MKFTNFANHDTLINNYIREIRSVDIQRDPMRFRTNLERIGSMMAYEISKTLDYTSVDVQTPLGIAHTRVIADDIVVASILRAGLPMHNGMLQVLDRAENCFVSAYRKYSDEQHFNVHIEYLASPRIDGKIVILCDPMLATGSSMSLAYHAILTKGKPKRVIIASIVAAEPAIEYLKANIHEDNVDVWCAVVDSSLNEHAYIVPGIGDAGDLAFGEKD